MRFIKTENTGNCGYCGAVLKSKTGKKIYCDQNCRRKLLLFLIKEKRIIFDAVRKCAECGVYFGIVNTVNKENSTCGNKECTKKLLSKKNKGNTGKRMKNEGFSVPKDYRAKVCHKIDSDSPKPCVHYDNCLWYGFKCKDGSLYEPIKHSYEDSTRLKSISGSSYKTSSALRTFK